MSSWLFDHLPVLQVIIPMLIAPICLLIGSRAVARVLMVAAAIIMLVISLLMLNGVMDGSVFRYALGGWAAPWGIEYRVDPLAAFILTTINLVHLVAAIFCLSRNDKILEQSGRVAFYVAWLLCIAGLKKS